MKINRKTPVKVLSSLTPWNAVSLGLVIPETENLLFPGEDWKKIYSASHKAARRYFRKMEKEVQRYQPKSETPTMLQRFFAAFSWSSAPEPEQMNFTFY